ncbi:MAG: KH domain-containing protein [Calditrichaeota bacterium]|nr:KH domain-containing protein [Calditrichota bacterium]MCB0271104.1 KH domain-containing protein [Calditrichota bacterium]MCB9069623.1 KH domain-containing protein [Calditrichia bacterium]
MKDFLENLVKHIVDKPDDVQINTVKGHGTIVFELRVNECDTGKVIGQYGQTANSLRILLGAVAAKNHQHSFLEILDPLPEKTP